MKRPLKVCALLGLGALSLLVVYHLGANPAQATVAFDGTWRLVASTDRDGNPIQRPAFAEARYIYDSVQGTETVQVYADGALLAEFDYSFTVLGNGDVRFEDEQHSLTMRPSVVGDTLTWTRQSWSGSEPEVPRVPPYPVGQVPPPPIPPIPGPPQSMVMVRVP